MKIEKRKVKDLKPNPENPRTISKSAMKALEKSIEKYGLVQPIIENKQTGYIVGGHRRLEALLKKKVKEADVIVVDMSPAEEKQLMIALNNPHSQGAFDIAGLQSIMSELEIEMEDSEFKELAFEQLVVQDEAVEAGDDGEDDDFNPDAVEDIDTGDPEEFLARQRVIISYRPEDKGKVEELLGIEIKKIVIPFEHIATMQDEVE